jgi:NADPH2:quinone reductase
MNAIVIREFGPPSIMKLEDVPDPSPGAGQVLIRVRAAGVNPVDTYIRSGVYARKPALPHTPGMDVAGTVEAVGAGVTSVKAGDRVYASLPSGGYAQLTIAEEWQVRPLPEATSFTQGAALGIPYATAWLALFRRAAARAGESVLIHGASGGVGLALVQMARAHGMHVIGTAGTDEGLAAVQAAGAHVALNHRTAGYTDQIPSLTRSGGVNVVIEMLANVNLDRDLDLIAPRGRIVIVGNRGRVEIDPRKAMARDAAIAGMMIFNASRDELHEAHAGIFGGLECGALKPVIGKELPLSEAPQAHEAVMQPGALGKIVLKPA